MPLQSTSLSKGFKLYGIFSFKLLQLSKRCFFIWDLKRYTDVSKITGGAQSWREYLTIPNILKQFNPDLQGFSTGIYFSKKKDILQIFLMNLKVYLKIKNI